MGDDKWLVEQIKKKKQKIDGKIKRINDVKIEQIEEEKSEEVQTKKKFNSLFEIDDETMRKLKGEQNPPGSHPQKSKKESLFNKSKDHSTPSRNAKTSNNYTYTYSHATGNQTGQTTSNMVTSNNLTSTPSEYLSYKEKIKR